MKLQIQSIHFSPSKALNEKIVSRLQKAFAPYPYIQKGNVFLKLQENEQEKGQIMEIRLLLKHSVLFAETRGKDLYKALDHNIEKLKRQLEKYKEKVYAKP